MNGLFLIDRKMLAHHIVGMGNKDRFCMWIWMLSAAAWKPRPIFVLGEEIVLQRGQLFVSLRKFAEENLVSKGVAERFIRDLKSGTMIETANRTGGTLITICNYETYQNFDLYRGTASGTANETATGQRRDIKEHQITPDNTRENILAREQTGDLFGDEPEKPKPKSKPKRAVSLPENWVPSETNVDHALSKGFTHQQIEIEGEKFRDYHLAKGSTFKDWNAAWRTWCRNARSFAKPQAGPGAGPNEAQERADRVARGLQEARERGWDGDRNPFT